MVWGNPSIGLLASDKDKEPVIVIEVEADGNFTGLFHHLVLQVKDQGLPRAGSDRPEDLEQITIRRAEYTGAHTGRSRNYS